MVTVNNSILWQVSPVAPLPTPYTFLDWFLTLSYLQHTPKFSEVAKE